MFQTDVLIILTDVWQICKYVYPGWGGVRAVWQFQSYLFEGFCGFFVDFLWRC